MRRVSHFVPSFSSEMVNWFVSAVWLVEDVFTSRLIVGLFRVRIALYSAIIGVLPRLENIFGSRETIGQVASFTVLVRRLIVIISTLRILFIVLDRKSRLSTGLGNRKLCHPVSFSVDTNSSTWLWQVYKRWAKACKQIHRMLFSFHGLRSLDGYRFPVGWWNAVRR